MKAIIVLMAVLLAGCGSTYKTSVAEDKPPLESALAEVCDPVPPSPVRGQASMGELYTFADTMVAKYGECALRDRGKYRWIKQQGH
jgi:hypothetical protein